LGDAVYGIALSSHNDEGCACKAGERCSRCGIDWNRVADNKVAFVFLRATQGARYKDPAFEYHWRALAQHKMHRGARHFMSADDDPVEQADHFVEQLEAAGKLTASDLPPVLELERDLRRDAAKKWIVVAETGQRLDFWQGQDPDEIVGKILKWLNRVEQKTGRAPIIYTSRSWWMERVKDEKKFTLLRRYPLWIADYPESGRHAHDAPKVPNNQAWTIWQFTENGRMEESGIIPGNVEVSVFRGTLARFRQAMKVSAVEAEVARAEDKQTARGGQQVAAVNPQQVSGASDANAAAATSATPSVTAASTASASQTAAPANPPHAATVASKQSDAATTAQTAAAAAVAPPAKSDQATQAPRQPTDTAASQVAAVANPAPPAVGSPPQQVRRTPQPQAPPQSAEAPPQAQKSQSQPANAGSAATQAPATQTAVVAQATQPSGAVASRQLATASTVPQTSANQQTAQSVKPAQQAPATSANASERVNTAPEAAKAAPSEQKAPPQVAAANLSSAKEAAGPNQGGTAPAAGEKAKTESQKANTASVAPPSRTAQRNSGQRAATEKAVEENMPGERAPTDKPAAERIMIEIELLNGRKLRVDANIDPALLERLINAIDK
jgi:lysozyme